MSQTSFEKHKLSMQMVLRATCGLLSLLLMSCSESTRNADWETLFNGQNLEGWHTYLGPVYQASGERSEAIGLNKDPDGVFSVVEQENENVMRISGQHFGGISTVAEFENYHLQLEFKWGGQKWPPRDNAKRDSGLLYHSVGPHGADYGYWMRSQELQIQEGDCGDYWGVAGAIFDIRAVMDADSNYYFDPKGELMTFSDKSNVGRHCIKSQDAERPSGEWNTIDLYSLGGTAIHVVNGVKNMILQSSRHQVDNTKMPLTRGKIQIQSEGAEVYYRNIRIRSISKLPESFTKS